VNNKKETTPIVPLTTVVSGNISNPSTGLPSKDGIVFLNRYESIRGYKNVIIVSVKGSTQKDRKRQDEEILLRRKEIFNNLSAGSHICILYLFILEGSV
jgi:hypothetical protein